MTKTVKKTETQPKGPAKAEYTSNIDGWIAGQRVVKGQTIELTAGQAKYAPVTPVAPKTAPSKTSGSAKSPEKK